MADTINERFLDYQVAQAIRWIRFGNREVGEALKIMARVDRELRKILIDPPGGAYTQARLNALQKQITEMMVAIHDGEVKPLIENMAKTVAGTAGALEAAQFQAMMPAGLDVTTPNLGVLQAAALIRPFNGAVLGDWIEDLKQNDLNRVWRTVLDGIISGETTDDLIRNVSGSAALRYKDGVREVTRRGIQALVRTSINHATNVGRQGVWEDNSDIIKGVRWVSTLDMRTTPICRDRDGEVYEIEKGPRPPAHPNCRSTTVAVLKSWRELGFDMDELDEPTRASMDGQVPGNLTYWEWFKRQSGDVQKEVLGKTRYDMWKSGAIKDPTEFTNDKGDLLTLEQLRSLNNPPKYVPLKDFIEARDMEEGPGWLLSWLRQAKPDTIAETFDPTEFGLPNWDQLFKADYDSLEWRFVMQKMGPVIRTIVSNGPDHADSIWYSNQLRGALELNTKPRPKVTYKLPSSTTMGTKVSIRNHIEDEMLMVRSILPDWMLREIKYDSEYHPGVTVEGGIRAYAKVDGGIHISHNEGWSVIIHEMFHELDHALTDYRDAGSTLQWDWGADSEVAALAADVRREFLERDGRGRGTFTNGDGAYALGNWRKNYEARLYIQDREGVSSEYITMNAQYYLDAYFKGVKAFRAERATMERTSPAMLKLLDHIFEKKGLWRRIPDDLEQVAQSQGFKVADKVVNRDQISLWTSSPEQLTRFDPAEFGLEKWPEGLSRLEKSDWNLLASDAYYVMVNMIIEGGKPNRYRTLLRQKIDKLRRRGLL